MIIRSSPTGGNFFTAVISFDANIVISDNFLLSVKNSIQGLLELFPNNPNGSFPSFDNSSILQKLKSKRCLLINYFCSFISSVTLVELTVVIIVIHYNGSHVKTLHCTYVKTWPK